ncbi:hypothetical protein HYPGJ_10332 [Hyphomicrobium sp. GJ21]|nr:hypothetical protein HYPGJ_10332 [Hyphomicrobium sp. GJ21]
MRDKPSERPFPLDNGALFEYQRANKTSPQTGGPSGACMTGSVEIPPADPLRHQKTKRNQQDEYYPTARTRADGRRPFQAWHP